MKYWILFAIVTNLFITAIAQEKSNSYFSLAVLTTQNAKPFGKFAGLFDEVVHPGIQAAYGRNIAMAQHHDWFVEFKMGYFYHRFVQHAIPLYLDFGYRYKITDHISVETSLGGGYMHSIPATAQLKLDSSGTYVNGKGVGRMQAIAIFSIGMGYSINVHATRPIKIFAAYQQMAQMPFVKSYVPVLPYNTFQFGVCYNLKSK